MANVRKYGMFKPCKPNGGVDLRWQRLMRKKGTKEKKGAKK